MQNEIKEQYKNLFNDFHSVLFTVKQLVSNDITLVHFSILFNVILSAVFNFIAVPNTYSLRGFIIFFFKSIQLKEVSWICNKKEVIDLLS